MQHDTLIALIIFQASFFLLDLYIFAKTTGDIVRKTEHFYYAALIVIHLVYLVMTSLWILQESDAIHLSRSLMKAVCTTSLSCVALCPFVFFIYTVIKIGFVPIWKRWFRILCSVPAVVVLLMIFSSSWTGWIFTLNEQTRFIHGPLYLFMVIASSLYLIAVICIAGINLATAKTLAKRKSSGALLLSVSIIIAFIVIDGTLNSTSVLPVAVFGVILVIFSNLLESNINNDALTGMNNRRKADEYMMSQLANVSKERPLYLYMCDLDSFKSINDIYGHMEGDEALRICSSAMKRTIARYNGFAARFGGDEFMLAWHPDRESDPEALILDVKNLLEEQARELNKPYNLSISVGYAVCDDRKESLTSCIRRADEMLYRRKEEYHRGRKSQEFR